MNIEKNIMYKFISQPIIFYWLYWFLRYFQHDFKIIHLILLSNTGI